MGKKWRTGRLAIKRPLLKPARMWSPIASHDMEFCMRYIYKIPSMALALDRLQQMLGVETFAFELWWQKSSLNHLSVFVLHGSCFSWIHPPLTSPRQEKKSRWEREEKGRKMYLLPFNDRCELYVGNNVLMLLDSSGTTLCSIRISSCIISMRKDLSFIVSLSFTVSLSLSQYLITLRNRSEAVKGSQDIWVCLQQRASSQEIIVN